MVREGTGVARLGDVFLGVAAVCVVFNMELDSVTRSLTCVYGENVQGDLGGEKGIRKG